MPQYYDHSEETMTIKRERTYQRNARTAFLYATRYRVHKGAEASAYYRWLKSKPSIWARYGQAK